MATAAILNFFIGLADFAAVAMETKKGRFKKKLDSFHQAS
jgi:hypothetical protein